MKTVLITGANGGLGRSLVEKYAQNDYSIIAHMRSEKKDFIEFSNIIEKKYRVKINCLYFDLRDEQAIDKGLKEIISKKIKIDILINNAGVAHGGLLQMVPMRDIRTVFDVNFFAAIQITQFISRWMKKNGGGVIINMASVAGIDLEAGNCAYGTSKAAVIALTKTLAQELAPYNIRINAVAPGLTNTEMATYMEKKAKEQMISQSAMNRLAEPEEIANLVYYLSSDKASFINGQTIRIDGGM